MATEHILIVRHSSPLRVTGDDEALTVLGEAELALPRHELSLDTRPYNEDIEGGYWDTSHAYLRRASTQIRDEADRLKSTKVYYVGIAEVPHVIALGAYVGDERLVEARDYDRDHDAWKWPNTEGTLTAAPSGLLHELVNQSGIAVVRVEISYSISDHDVDAAVGKERLADIRIQPSEGRNPAPGLVKSPLDVAAVRASVRDALAAISRMRPNTEAIHLFVAAPVSVCFAIGQELRLRNSTNVWTYRYRVSPGEKSYKPAILLTAGWPQEVEQPLTPAAIALARRLRDVWQVALTDVIKHAAALKARARAPKPTWYENLYSFTAKPELKPFPGLKPMCEIVGIDDCVSLEPRPEDYEFSKEHRAWKFSDGLLLRMYDAAAKDDERLRGLGRLFFWHEYVHDGQGLTKYTAEGVGSFANCLEQIDYMADAYGILHHVDMLVGNLADAERTDASILKSLREQTDALLRSFWPFERLPPNYVWQERRLRRYMNWYWRRVQIREAASLDAALRLLIRQPCIEIAGFEYRVRPGRLLVVLNEKRLDDVIEIGLILEDGRFWRAGTSRVLNIAEVMLAFAHHDHETIDHFFSAIYETAK